MSEVNEDGVELSETRDDVMSRLDNLVKQLNQTKLEVGRLEADATTEINAIKIKYEARLKLRKTLIGELTTRITEIFKEHRELLLDGDTKEVKLMSGTLKAHWTPPALKYDKAALEKWLRNNRLWQRFSDPQPRKLNHNRLKQAKDIIKRIPKKTAWYSQDEILDIKRPDYQLLESGTLDTRRVVASTKSD